MTISQHLVPVEAAELPITVARAGGHGAAIVIVPSIFGIHDDLQEQMEELAKDASLVLATDTFFREGKGPVPYDDLAQAIQYLQTFDRKRAYRDIRAAIAWARAQEGISRVVMLGICFGGSYALLAAADGAVDGVVTWHGSRMESFVQRAAEIRCPMHLHFGSLDPIVPPAALATLRDAFAGHSNVQIIEHADATHGFSHRTAAAYNPRAEHAGMASLRELAR
jgi:carboxymethylenebutenolidase